jgi:hypothetical protein
VPGDRTPKKRPDDARRGHRRFEHVGLEPLIEEVDRAQRHQLNLVVLILARQRAKALQQEEELLESARIERRGIGRQHPEDRLHEAAHLDHRASVLVVRVRIQP